MAALIPTATPATRRRGRLAAHLRVAALLTTVAAASLAVALHAVSAHAAEGVLDVGAGLLEELGPHRRDPPRELVLNGLVLHVASGSVDRPASAVIDGFANRCRELGPRLDRDLAKRGAPAHVLAAALPRSVLDATLHTRSRGRAAAACLHTGALTFEQLGAQLERFAASADLADLGALSFLYAQQHGRRTSYLLLETSGPVPLHKLFPPAVDAPGRDLSGLPRPQGSRRLLSAWQPNARPMLALYATSTSTTAAAERYRETLSRAGVSVVVRGRDGRSPWLVARAGERSWLASFMPATGGTQVAVTPLD